MTHSIAPLRQQFERPGDAKISKSGVELVLGIEGLNETRSHRGRDVGDVSEVARVANGAPRRGLLERVRKSDISIRQAEKEATRQLLQHVDYGEGILCGNSIHTDRSFISKFMPGFDRALHYRMVDVSSLKIITRAWVPNAPGRSRVDASHTVLSDLRASIGELAYYQQTFFKKPNEL